MAKTSRTKAAKKSATTTEKVEATTEKVASSKNTNPSEAEESRARTLRDQFKSEARANRAGRVPYVGTASRMDIPKSIRDQYPSTNRYRWVNDEESQVQRRKQAGWEPVVDDRGEIMSRPVGRGKSLPSISAIAMTIPYEYFKEDFDAQQTVNMAFHSSLKKGAEKVKDVGNVPGGTYAPNLEDGGRGFTESTSDRLIS